MPNVRFSAILTLILLAGSCSAPAPKPVVPDQVRTVFFDPQKLSDPFGIAARGTEMYVSDGEKGTIAKISSGGEPTIVTDKLHTPSQIAIEADGSLIVADSGSHTIKRVRRDGSVERVAGVEGRAGFSDGPADSAEFRSPVGVAVSGARIYVADTYNDRIRVIENGQVRTLAGNGRGFADSADSSKVRFDSPTGIAIGFDGSVIVCDSGNARLRAVRGNGATTTIAGGAREFGDGPPESAGLYQPLSVVVAPDGTVWFTDGSAVRRIELSPFPYVRTVSNQKRGFADGKAADASFNQAGGIAVDSDGGILVADSENQAVRKIATGETGRMIKSEEIERSRPAAEQFRSLAPARWPYDPPQNTREIAGTLGEIRGENDGSENVWFHNGLDIVGGYGETARFIRDEKVLRPLAAENFGTLRELLRMPTLGYIHIRLGRDSSETSFGDPRFVFNRDEGGKIAGVRVPRGARFTAGEPIGTLNPMNHVHLIAGRSGAEMNALAALDLPGVSDRIAPVVEKIELFDENFRQIETDSPGGRIRIVGNTRIVARAYDRMDGNAERRRLGVYRLGYQILNADKSPAGDQIWPIRFDRLPAHDAVTLVYARGSKSGATGETIFRYLVTNEIAGETAREGFVSIGTLPPGDYVLRVFAADFFGNIGSADLPVSIGK